MTNNNLRLLVISDLHAIVSKKQNSDSHLFFENGSSEYGESFLSYAKNLNHDIDVLVCAGDISNQADKECFLAGWKFIQKVKDELGIPELLCVPGNHDHQSRSNHIFDPKHRLQFVSPQFPFSCNEKNTHFWAWHWCYSGDNSHYNAISLNTSAYHGFQDEHKYGRVATEVSDQICDFVSLDGFQKKSINLLICHHHPQKMQHIDKTEDHEVMAGGQYLLHKLYNTNKGPWLVIHGHKHFADITYASASGMNPPVIFSSGSMSARLHGGIEDRTANQFYMIELDLDKCASEDKAVGTFETHERLIGIRWGESQSTNLPAKSGFGSLHSPKSVADKISSLISNECPFLNKQELSRFYDLTKNFTPSDFDRLVKALESKGLSVAQEHSLIIEVGKPNV